MPFDGDDAPQPRFWHTRRRRLRAWLLGSLSMSAISVILHVARQDHLADCILSLNAGVVFGLPLWDWIKLGAPSP